MVTLYDCLP